MRENWKDIKGYEGLYQVSDLGRVKSFRKNKIGIILNPWKGNIPYFKTVLSKDGEKKTYLIHRLVAETFISNPNNLEQVNHIDCNKENNCVKNLEWCSRSENMKHAFKNNLLFMPYKGVYGYDNNKSKTTLQYDLQGNFIKEWGSSHLAGETLKIKYSNICMCCRGERKTAGGYIWKYKESVK